MPHKVPFVPHTAITSIAPVPIYEYRCQACGDKFEKLLRRSEDAMESGCPAGMCGSPGMCERN